MKTILGFILMGMMGCAPGGSDSKSVVAGTGPAVVGPKLVSKLNCVNGHYNQVGAIGWTYEISKYDNGLKVVKCSLDGISASSEYDTSDKTEKCQVTSTVLRFNQFVFYTFAYTDNGAGFFQGYTIKGYPNYETGQTDINSMAAVNQPIDYQMGQCVLQTF